MTHTCPECGTTTEAVTVDQPPLFSGSVDTVAKETVTLMCPGPGCGWHSRPTVREYRPQDEP